MSDEELIARLEDDAPEVLRATIPEAEFDAAVGELVKESPKTRGKNKNGTDQKQKISSNSER
jgi:hypothetical protein